MRYVADDGKVFENEQECLKYEAAIKDKRAKELEERKKREEEIKTLQDKINKCDKQKKEYQAHLDKLISESVVKIDSPDVFPFSTEDVLNALRPYWKII